MFHILTSYLSPLTSSTKLNKNTTCDFKNREKSANLQIKYATAWEIGGCAFADFVADLQIYAKKLAYLRKK